MRYSDLVLLEKLIVAEEEIERLGGTVHISFHLYDVTVFGPGGEVFRLEPDVCTDFLTDAVGFLGGVSEALHVPKSPRLVDIIYDFDRETWDSAKGTFKLPLEEPNLISRMGINSASITTPSLHTHEYWGTI